MIKFPKIYRSITEWPKVLSEAEGNLLKRASKLLSITSKAKFILLVFVSLLFFLIFLTVALDLRLTLLENQKLNKERQVLQDQIQFWQAVSDKFPGYRDAYFQIALLEYRLKDFNKSKDYLNKTLDLDPNFKEGRELEKLLN